MFLPQLLSFLASCVSFDKDIKFTDFDSPVYKIVPIMITKIAYGSRRDSGFRLLKRCVRHSTDAKYYPGKISVVTIYQSTIEGREKILLDWSCSIPASMKNASYSTRVCISTDGSVICCECKCKIGGADQSDDEANMLCVHICPSITKLTMILFDYLAEDVCYELASMLTTRGLPDALEDSVKILASVASS